MDGHAEAVALLEEVFRVIGEKTIYPQFADRGVPISVAAKVLGMNPDTVRNQMENGTLKIGSIWYTQGKNSKKPRRNIYISPKLFWELTGFVWSGEEKEES